LKKEILAKPWEIPVNIEYAAWNIDRLLTAYLTVSPRPPFVHKLYEVAEKIYGKPLSLVAAERLIEAVKPGDVVIISTGWCLPPRLSIDWLPRGENDGPSGAALLGHAVSYGLDGKIVFMQEEAMIPVMEACASASGMRVFSIEDLKKMPREVRLTGLTRASVTSFPIDEDEAKVEAKRVIEDLKPSAIITVEKAGRNKYGVWHSGLGRDMSSTTAKMDYLIEEAKKQGILTVGIGDCGNEIGFGLIEDAVRKYFINGDKCKCPCGGGTVTSTATDVLAISSCSNNVPIGIAAIMSIMLEDPKVLIDADTFLRTVEAGVRAGALCGYRLKPELSVHGIDIKYHIHWLELVRAVAKYAFVKYKGDLLRA
jgi:hypothetical protein